MKSRLRLTRDEKITIIQGLETLICDLDEVFPAYKKVIEKVRRSL